MLQYKELAPLASSGGQAFKVTFNTVILHLFGRKLPNKILLQHINCILRAKGSLCRMNWDHTSEEQYLYDSCSKAVVIPSLMKHEVKGRTLNVANISVPAMIDLAIEE